LPGCEKEYEVKGTSRRKYCFECSPFGYNKAVGNYRKRPAKDGFRICGMCHRELLESEQFYKRNKDKYYSQCKNCRCTIENESIRRKKKKAVLEMGGCCKICGYDKCFDALAFHHVNPSKKEYGIKSVIRLRWEKFILELKKCVLLCVRCHSEVHVGLHPEYLCGR